MNILYLIARAKEGKWKHTFLLEKIQELAIERYTEMKERSNDAAQKGNTAMHSYYLGQADALLEFSQAKRRK